MEKTLLVLDLDETLIWATETPAERPHDFIACGQFYVYKRPHLEAFVEACFADFEVAVWSSASRDYAEEIAVEIFRDFTRLRFLWARERCTWHYDVEAGASYWLKDLKKIRKMGCPLERVLVVDDSPEKLKRHYGNHVAVAPFLGDASDDELPALSQYLHSLRDVVDVRSVEKRGWRRRVRS